MEKRKLFFSLILLFVPALFGMGSLSGSSPEKIPIPAQKYSATFIDQVDMVTECREVSIEGATFIEGQRGKGIYTVPFSKTDSILFQLEGERLKATIRLSNGETIEMFLNRKHRAYGLTRIGTFQIPLLDLKKMVVNRGGKTSRP